MTARRFTGGMNAATYIRVSDPKQGKSGLGLEAQTASVLNFVRAHGLHVVQEFREVETGTNKRKRPELRKALDAARRENAVLLIARIDRLARNVAFIANLMEARVPFVAVDMPDVDDLTIHVLAAVAEKEAKRISSTTKEALSAARARGVKLGNPQNLTQEAREKAWRANTLAAVEAYARVAGYIRLMRKGGLSLRAIAAVLNDEGHRTRQGKRWTAVQVSNVLRRGEATSSAAVQEVS